MNKLMKALPSRGRVGWGGGRLLAIARRWAPSITARRLPRPLLNLPASTPSPDPFPLEGKGRFSSC